MKLQFDSFIEMLTELPDDNSCREYMERERWNGVPMCPYCKVTDVYHLKQIGLYKCGFCRERFTVTKFTMFESSHIGLRKWFIGLWLFQAHKKGISAHQLSKDLKITIKSAWFMLHRIREGMKEDDQNLEGDIQMDESFVGGKNKNRHHDKKVEQSQGRSFKDKTPVFGMMQSAETEIIERPNKKDPSKTVIEKVYHKFAKVVCKVVPDTTGKSLKGLIYKHIKFGSNIVTDEWMAYVGLGRRYIHDIVDHRRGQYVNEYGRTTNAIEGFWTWLKKTYSATYHTITRKYLQRYADEIAFRYNYHRLKDGDRFNTLLSNAFNSRITYKKLVA